VTQHLELDVDTCKRAQLVEHVARPVPLLLPAVSDGRFFSRLGIQTYGFLPMQLPQELRFMELIHAEDERIPVDSVEFGTTAIRLLLERFGQATARSETFTQPHRVGEEPTQRRTT
jgi:acetylornithine deacetylase/succinyl-diaminopimelate desuccinylase-like protein